VSESPETTPLSADELAAVLDLFDSFCPECNSVPHGVGCSVARLRVTLDAARATAPAADDRERLVSIMREYGVGVDRAMRIADAYGAGVSPSTGDALRAAAQAVVDALPDPIRYAEDGGPIIDTLTVRSPEIVALRAALTRPSTGDDR
jgi:hypothetical protein